MSEIATMSQIVRDYGPGMKALSIRQPWAWLIVKGYKDIENRTWATKLRGRVFVHASKGMTRAEYEDAADLALGWG
jgi:hypothetical protein